MKIQGKTAFIAGATSGLGLGAARYFAERGANVVLVGRRRELAEKLAAELGDNALGLGADITDPEQVTAAVQAATDRFGAIDINLNTAGYIAAVGLTTADGTPTDLAEFSRMVTTNLVGTFNVMSHAAAAMLDNEPDDDGERGVIINTSSAAAHDGTVGMVGYSATKAALVGMTLPAAREFAGRGIRVNTIVAGGFDTPIFDGFTDDAAIAQQVQHFAGPRRLGRPEEFAAFAAHLVENGYFNASNPRLDAGYRIPLQF
ncbi:SDR family oxidoreductase [Streptomyces spinoverrucosus]|uniref:SDR family oxidoreductase n=1 Tax=Streptomyces spinoverrucosus TaxID=284043 RepID=UPI0018C3CD3D|nr:SDR family NAD(P)-dependent oxidoreductase [Streptomyces spinoverrucosus]MBG0851404.1 SDR family oxidoreductase [Streptomyces spinoverrucosus]